MNSHAFEGQRRMSELLKLQVAVSCPTWALRMKLMSLGRTVLVADL